MSELRRHATDLEHEAASLRRRAASIEAQELAQFEADMIAGLTLPSIVPPSAGGGATYF